MSAPEPARILALDHIRGLSILGILMVNAIGFAMPMAVYSNPGLSPLGLSLGDLATWWGIEVFCHDKFITLFSMLFGISLYLVGQKQEDGPTLKKPLFRRLGWLAVFGLIHGALIWYGDVLLLYAMTGFVLWRWRHSDGHKLILWGSGLFVIGTAVLVFPMLYLSAGAPGALAPVDVIQQIAVMHGGFWSSLAGNFSEWRGNIVANIANFLPRTLGLMMLGLGLFKQGVLRGAARSKIYAALIAAGALSLIPIALQADHTVKSHFAFPAAFGIDTLANSFLCVVVALGYASLLIVAAKTRIGRVILYPLACAGRMAFSNYIAQSLIMTALFYGGRGSGDPLYGELTYAGLLPIVLSLWAGQLLVSTLWLQVFRYGPLEWGWRCLTWRQWLPLLR